MRTALLLIAVLATDPHLWRLGGQASVDTLIANKASDEILDRVCGQKDCRASRLFWYTDLEEAKAAAKKSGRPILSLSLLGRLDEELSCANSRFFRVMLYSDPAISAILREKYVLYWHSVRPVPQVTIDMGDGRKIRQTITGNSIHYLLDADGNVLDGLPGLHSPAAFRRQLEEWLALDRASFAGYHRQRARGPYEKVDTKATAQNASVYAATKGIIERPLLRELTLATRVPEVELNLPGDVVFSEESLALMRTKQPISEELLANLRRTVATDTFVNDELHSVIHQWFVDGEVSDLTSLNERVYAELFRTPGDDPWLGLNPAPLFAAIEQ
jgi:hypothetical protein